MKIRIETKNTGQIMEVDADEVEIFFKKHNPMHVKQDLQKLVVFDYPLETLNKLFTKHQTEGKCVYSSIDVKGVWCKANGLSGCLGREFCDNYIGEKNILIKEQVTA